MFLFGVAFLDIVYYIQYDLSQLLPVFGNKITLTIRSLHSFYKAFERSY